MFRINIGVTRLHDEIANTQQFIADQFSNIGRTTAVIGLSGGLDSAIVLDLSIRALSVSNVHAVFIDIYSSPKSYNDAKRIAKHLGVGLDYINLNDVFDVFVKAEGIEGNELTMGNLKARLRMSILYVRSEKYDGLVVNTCNKSETMVGYETKWGDAAGDFAPLGNYYKTELFAMARLLGFPQWLVDKIPSADLWDGQSDEDEMGITYVILDVIIEVLENYPEYLSNLPFDKIEKVQGMIRGSAHKRRLPQPAMRVVPAILAKVA